MSSSVHSNIADEFAELINECEGQVAFVTGEGDRLIANSMLSALVGFSTILSVAERLDLQLECENPHDGDRIIAFLKKYKLGQFAASSACCAPPAINRPIARGGLVG